MGMVICPKHGNQVMSFVSPRVSDSIKQGEDIDFDTFEIELCSIDGVQSKHVIDNLFFASIQDKYGITESEKRIMDVDLSFEIFSDLSPTCPECLNLWLIKSGRRQT